MQRTSHQSRKNGKYNRRVKNDKVLKKENEDRQEERKLQNEGNAKKKEETRKIRKKKGKTGVDD